MGGGHRLKEGRILHKYAASFVYSETPIICPFFCQPSPATPVHDHAEWFQSWRMKGLTKGRRSHNYTCVHKHALTDGPLSDRSTTQTEIDPVPKNRSLHY